MIANFSGLELHLTTKGHAFGSFVSCLLRMHNIGKATRSLRIILRISSEVIYTLCYTSWVGIYI